MRTTEQLNEIKAVVTDLIAAPSCCAELKDAGRAYLDAIGTDKEAAAAKALIAEASDDITGIDALIAFAGSDRGRDLFGKDMAATLEAHGREIKAKGAVYCDCAACSGAEKLLNMKELILIGAAEN